MHHFRHTHISGYPLVLNEGCFLLFTEQGHSPTFFKHGGDTKNQWLIIILYILWIIKKKWFGPYLKTAYPYNHRVLRYQAITGVLSHPFSLRPYHFDVFEVLKGGTLGTLHSKKAPFPDKQPMFCLTCHLVGGIPTPLKNDGLRQLGWWHSQYI